MAPEPTSLPDAEYPLFMRRPDLASRIPRLPIATLPTPVERLDSLSQELGLPDLFIKRDDLAGDPYGGNKVRKLEFLLAKAKAAHGKETLTFGYAGSNHATATAIYAHQAGLHPITMVLPQANTHYLQRNLLTQLSVGTELHQVSTLRRMYAAVSSQMALHTLKRGKAPTIIPAGGSSALGSLGFVNAALELRAQIDAGEMPEPDLIYVAVGSMGTAAGLLPGLKLAGLNSHVVGVRVAGDAFVDEQKLFSLAEATAELAGIEFERMPPRLTLRHDFFGKKYAVFTEESAEARAVMEGHTGIPLDGTYTGKAFAALLHDARQGLIQGKKVLFWNTYNSHPQDPFTQGQNYRDLPKAFHAYFEEDVQPLDR